MTDPIQTRLARINVAAQTPQGPAPNADAMVLELQMAAADVASGQLSPGEARTLLMRSSHLELGLPPGPQARVAEARRLLAGRIDAAEARAASRHDRVESTAARPTQTADARAHAAERALARQIESSLRGAPPGAETQQLMQSLFGSERQARATTSALGALRAGQLDELLGRTCGSNAAPIRAALEECTVRFVAGQVGSVNEDRFSSFARELEAMSPEREEALLRALREGDRRELRWASRAFGPDAAAELTALAREMDTRPEGRAAAFERLESLRRSAAATAREAAAFYGSSAAYRDPTARVLVDTDLARRQVERELGMTRGSALEAILRRGMEGARRHAENSEKVTYWAGRALHWTLGASGPVGAFVGVVGDAAQYGVARQRAVDLRIGGAAGLVSDTNLRGADADATRALVTIGVNLGLGLATNAVGSAVDAARDAGKLRTPRADAVSDAVTTFGDYVVEAGLFVAQEALEYGLPKGAGAVAERLIPGAEPEVVGMDPDEAARQVPMEP